jgi:hypothetical protein
MPLTKKQALRGKINYELPDDAYEIALIEAGLNGDDEFTADDAKDIDLCAAGLILIVLTSANESEGGYSISISDRAGLLKIRSLILKKWGIADDTLAPAPLIKDISYLW